LSVNAQTEVKALSKDGNMLSETLKNSVIARRTIAPTTGNFGAVERLGLSIKTLHQLLARESSLPGRKIILWVSPGWPMLWGPGTVDLTPSQQSEMFSNVVNLSRELRDGRFTVYFVNPLGAGEDRGNAFYYKDFLKGISKPSQIYAGALALQVIAIQSGGLVFNASNDIAGELQMCMADNANYYGLSFDSPPAEHPDEYHQIEIQIAKPGLVARTREGYYNQP